MRGIAGAFERSWSGEPGTVAWTQLLHSAAVLYAIGSGIARRRAARSRRNLPGAHVVAVGNLTVGGTGKSTLARWLAVEALKAGAPSAVLLRGHGAGTPEPGVVPDFAGYPLEERVASYGDEAIAHRMALPRGISVAVDRDRRRAGRTARDGYGARVLVLDDGWEQSGLRWNELWVALDPRRPAGNGALLPAGPLRRPVSTLREAGVIAFLLEESHEEIPAETLRWADRVAKGVPRLRFLRTLLGTTPPGASRAPDPPRGGEGIGLISGIGSPPRLTRFARGSGVDVKSHAAFPDHARWRGPELLAAVERARAAGAGSVWITEKDEPRWPRDLRPSLPVRVIRTGLRPLDPVDDALRSLRRAAAERELVR
ncbi:MAG TPA: tetraacyldisaccharide 4'-kinase [Candidatus Dormibacteraeota bacterium]|nr:tetraacyldisaccharide 4'-kinase [Candidatus Dormibacteraeota bacterium]